MDHAEVKTLEARSDPEARGTRLAYLAAVLPPALQEGWFTSGEATRGERFLAEGNTHHALVAVRDYWTRVEAEARVARTLG